MAAAVAFFIILQVFPLYARLFPPNQAYAAFGVFLVLMFWLYLLGMVLVGGAELNAFLEEPGRSTALAATKARAEKGQVEMHQEGAAVQAEATGTGWAAGEETSGSQAERPGPSGRRAARAEAKQHGQPSPDRQNGRGGGSTIPGKLIGFAGLTVAALLLRGGHPTAEPEASRR
jgi:Virulence factor BrkB